MLVIMNVTILGIHLLKQNNEAKNLVKFTTTSIQDLLTRLHSQDIIYKKMFCQKE